MNQLPKEVTQLILGYLDDVDLARACSVDRNMRNRVCNNDYWVRKLQSVYGLGLDDIILKPNQTYAGYYFELYNVFKLREPTRALRYYVRHGDLNIVKAAIFLGARSDAGMFYEATENGYYDIIKYMFESGSYQPSAVLTRVPDKITMQLSMSKAIKMGREDIADLFRNNGYIPLMMHNADFDGDEGNLLVPN